MQTISPSQKHLHTPPPPRWHAALTGLIGTFILLTSTTAYAASDRINQEGRVLGPAPSVSGPVLFNTPQADAVVSAMQIMPTDSAWNEDVSRLPLLPNSAAMIAQVMADLGSSRQTLRTFYEMNYALVPDTQPAVAVAFFNYPDESDPSPYPIPMNLPIEGWPQATGTLTLDQWQRDVNNTGGDRHAITVQPGAGTIWETWLTRLTGSGWQASNGAKFDLKSNTLRPAGWTSGDAAGLPMFPAVVRYDECERGMVEHAMRVVVKRSRVGPIYPATHQASVGNTTDPNVPAMGQRVRLKADFAVPAAWSKEEKAVLRGLKKYGAIVADNGGFFSISVCPDDRFPAGVFDHLSTVGIGNFEVVQSTGAVGGPRSPGAPSVSAGSDSTASPNAAVALSGSITAPGGVNVEVGWKSYSGLGSVTFADPTQPITTATFSAPGNYKLMLSAADGVHAVAYSTVDVAVVDGGIPVITSTASAAGQVGRAFVYQITASNKPTAFAAGAVYGGLVEPVAALPDGLSLDPASGLISGTPTREGDYVIEIQAANAAGADRRQIPLTLATVAGEMHPTFFTGEQPLANGVYYLDNFYVGAPERFFGLYSYLSDPRYVYHFDLGYEYVFDAADGKSGVYFYDFASSGFFYTSPVFPFPYLYDFSLDSVVYYYPDPLTPGRYNTDGTRYFFVFNTGGIITK